MTKDEIISKIENAPTNVDHSTEMLVFYDSAHAYCVHGMKWSSGTEIVVTHLYPGRVHSIEELPDDIESMESMWYEDLMDKYEDLYEAMKSVK